MQTPVNRLIMLALLGAAFFSLAACGQKGALFIPEDPDAEQVQEATRAATKVPDNSEEESFFKIDSEEDAKKKAE